MLRERCLGKWELTLWIPETWREATAADAAAPTKREATAKAFKGIRLEWPAYPLLNDTMPHPNWVALAVAHHQWVPISPPTPSFSSTSTRFILNFSAPSLPSISVSVFSARFFLLREHRTEREYASLFSFLFAPVFFIFSFFGLKVNLGLQ